MPSLAELCADLAAEHAALDALVASLPHAAWATTTPADGWDVRDCIGHLCFFDEAATSALDDPERFVVERAALVDALATAATGHRTPTPDEALARALSPPQLLQRWRASRQRLLDTLAVADPHDRVEWYGPAMGVTSFATARIMETWAHGTDVADALGAAPSLSDRLRHVCHLGVAARPYAFAANGRPDPGNPVRVEALAPSGTWWTWGPDGAGDRVRGSALDVALVLTKRRHPSDTDIEVHGPAAEAWIEVAQAFAGPPGTGRQPGMRRLVQHPR